MYPDDLRKDSDY